jgi:mRNA interferase HigB
VWVISKSRLRGFWQRPGLAEAQGPLSAWYKHVEAASWSSWNDVRSNFRSADLVGNCTVFNIGGNKYRLATRILFESHKVFILRVMTHHEYDDGAWR